MWEGLGDDSCNEEDMFTSSVCSVQLTCDVLSSFMSCISFIYLFIHFFINVQLILFQLFLHTAHRVLSVFLTTFLHYVVKCE